MQGDRFTSGTATRFAPGDDGATRILGTTPDLAGSLGVLGYMRLPPHHVRRVRLTSQCADAPVVVVEAAAGFGKSVLGAELALAWGAVPIAIALEHDRIPGSLFLSRIVAAASAAGYTEAAAAALALGDDAAGAIDAITASLAAECCAFVVDDAQELSPDAAALLERLAAKLVGAQHLVVLARALPPGAERLRRADHVHLEAADLTMDDHETLDLCRRGFGIEVAQASAAALRVATGGWTAATVLAASRVARTGETLEQVAGVRLDSRGHVDAVARILSEAVASFSPAERRALAQLARLPLLDADLVDRSIGAPGLFARAFAGGIPLTSVREPWWEVPTVVREHLATIAAPDRDVLRRAANAYVGRGESLAALETLLACSEFDAAGAVLASVPPSVIEPMDVVELLGIFERLPLSVVDANPTVLLHVARRLRVGARFEHSNRLLDRARAIAVEAGDEGLRRAVDAEHAHELVRELRPEDARGAARAVLDDAGPTEQMTMARAYQALAMALCWQKDAVGHRDEAALDEAVACFEQCVASIASLGCRQRRQRPCPTGRSTSSSSEATRTGHSRCSTAPSRTRHPRCTDGRSSCASGHGWPQSSAWTTSAGRVQRRRCASRGSSTWTSSPHRAIGSSRSSPRTGATPTRRLRACARSSCIAAAGGRQVQVTSSQRQPTSSIESVTSPLPASTSHASPPSPRMPGTSWRCRQPRSRRDTETRSARPKLLDQAAELRIDPREYWRVTLLRAFAAFRGGDYASAGALAARAFEQAAAHRPADRAADQRGRTSPSSCSDSRSRPGNHLRARSRPLRCRPACVVLGRFELTVGGRPVPLGSGQEVRLMKLVALHRRLQVETAISQIWPDSDLDSGRNRLRTVLSRLRSAVGDVVARQGELLQLRPDVTVDVDLLHEEARRAQALAPSDPGLAASIARGAMARYRGELLADDPFEEWAERPRERARREMLDLISLCANEAAARGDLDAVRRLIERAIEIDPYDDTLYVNAATVLLEQGRRGEALSVLRRAEAALGELGLPTPAGLVDLELELRR